MSPKKDDEAEMKLHREIHQKREKEGSIIGYARIEKKTVIIKEHKDDDGKKGNKNNND